MVMKWPSSSASGKENVHFWMDLGGSQNLTFDLFTSLMSVDGFKDIEVIDDPQTSNFSKLAFMRYLWSVFLEDAPSAGQVENRFPPNHSCLLLALFCLSAVTFEVVFVLQDQIF